LFASAAKTILFAVIAPYARKSLSELAFCQIAQRPSPIKRQV
jgi:hypothetical protein